MNFPRPIDIDEQTARWCGSAGHAWVDAQPLLDAMFKPFEDQLVEAVRAGAAQRVLDVGCGTGSTTLAVARGMPAQGRCTGVDISAPMIAAARARAERDGTPARFIQADAQRHAFEAGSVDMIISRFGVMFFEEPVAAFANLRHAAADGARLCLIAWRSAAENPFMTTAERAAAPLLPELPARQPGAPGQFGFADRGRVATILEASGWTDVDIEPIDADCSLPEAALAGYIGRMGPVGLVLQQADEATRVHVVGTARAAFEPYVFGDEVRFTAACWRISAVANHGTDARNGSGDQNEWVMPKA